VALTLYCTVSVIALLVTRVLFVVLVMVAVMTVVPVVSLVAKPLPLLRRVLIVATPVFDEGLRHGDTVTVIVLLVTGVPEVGLVIVA